MPAVRADPTSPPPPRHAGQRIDRFLADAIGTLSRSRVKTLIEEARLTRGGRPDHRAGRTGAGRGYVYTLDVPPPHRRHAAAAGDPIPHTV